MAASVSSPISRFALQRFSGQKGLFPRCVYAMIPSAGDFHEKHAALALRRNICRVCTNRKATYLLPLHTWTRRLLHGQDCRPLRRLVPVLLRWMDEEQSHSSGPGSLERLRQALSGQPAISLGHSRPTLSAEQRPERQPAKDRRLLRRVYG